MRSVLISLVEVEMPLMVLLSFSMMYIWSMNSFVNGEFFRIKLLTLFAALIKYRFLIVSSDSVSKQYFKIIDSIYSFVPNGSILKL